jgi:hypothetical protein
LGVVARENQKPGDASWNVPIAMWAPQQQLALWASPYEAHAGDTVRVRVHATRGPVSISVYRLGWYGGVGGRLLVSQPNVAAPGCSLAATSSLRVASTPFATHPPNHGSRRS